MGRRYLVMGLIYLTLFVYLFLFFLPHSIRALSATDLGTSHNLSWRGGGGMEEKSGGLQFFLHGIWGALKCQKMTLVGSSSFF